MKMWECMFKKYKRWQYNHYIQNQNTCLSLDGEPFWAWRVSVQKQEQLEKKNFLEYFEIWKQI